MSVCHVCGNETALNDIVCGFCGAQQDGAAADSPAAIGHRIVNIERGRPLVETALKKMESELLRARSDRVKVVTLIHGYGSSGKGGRIRTECRKVLDHLSRRKEVNQIIAGEEFRKRTGPGKALLRRFPGLEQSCGSDFNNPGISIAVL